MSAEGETPRSAADSPAEPLRFPLVYLFYAVTLIGAGLATFGAAGLVPAFAGLMGWATGFASRRRPRALAYVALALLLSMCTCGLLLPAVSVAREPARRMQCLNNLKQIALALHNYDATYGSLPPAYIADASGKPMHSWRVLILPFLEQ